MELQLALDDMILTETLFPHLQEIDETAHRRVEQIMTELLEEIVNAELIFCYII